MPLAVIMLGSNSGNKKEFLRNALRLLAEEAGKVTRTSSLYETAPWGFESNETFLNQAIVVETDCTPDALLEICLSVEAKLGRVRMPGIRYTSRTIDIDILFYDNKILSTDTLTLPHPRIHERNFVLIPLCEIMPTFIHPQWNKTIEQLRENSTDTLHVARLAPAPSF